jgi:hypothetical protein
MPSKSSRPATMRQRRRPGHRSSPVLRSGE